MLIVGAKGFAKEILEIVHQNGSTDNLCFYDDVNTAGPAVLFEKFKILKNLKEAGNYFENVDKNFTIGIGNPKLRYQLYKKFENTGGSFISTISKNALIGSFCVEIGEGCNILPGVQISNSVKIGTGNMIYYNSVITHDVTIGDFCEISPSVNILGNVTIGNFVNIGSGSVIFPGISIGDHAVIAAGAVVRENVPEKTMVAGVPAIIKKRF